MKPNGVVAAAVAVFTVDDIAIGIRALSSCKMLSAHSSVWRMLSALDRLAEDVAAECDGCCCCRCWLDNDCEPSGDEVVDDVGVEPGNEDAGVAFVVALW